MVVLEPGTTIGHYRILEKLGQGGQASAFKAEDLRLRRTVVVKVLRPELATDASRKRFEREARLCSALDHPGICGVHDVGEVDGLPFIVFQFVEGQTLKQLMGGRPLAPLSALSIGIQIADALAAAHARGIVHRDLKPSNVVVTPSGQARILDFGLAKMLAEDETAGAQRDESVTELGVPYGSIGYGSPEQVSGERVDHRSDVFSLGVMLYEMLAGQAPFRGKNRIEVMHAVVHQEPRPLTEVNKAAPAGAQAILQRAMTKSPRARLPMAALREELKALMRELSRETGVVPTEASATLLAPQRVRASWLLGSTLGRVFRRRPPREGRSDPGTPTPVRAALARSRPPSWGSEDRKTLAVLPFKNLSGDAEADFYEVSLADAVITELANLRSLVVRPSAYTAHYAGQTVDPRQAGEELAVSSVLQGSFIKAPDRLRVTVQLVATESGQILWSDKIDVPAADLITVQDTLAERLIAGLRLKLTPEEQERIERPLTTSPQAYEFYLRGRDLLFQYIARTFDDADLDVAISMFREAVRLDPSFAQAYTALGRCHVHHAQGYGGPDHYRQAEEALRRARDLDPGLAHARLYMVYVDLHRGDRDRAHEAIAELERELPHDPAVVFVAAMLYRLDGLYDKALAAYDRLLEINPADLVVAGFNKARVYTHQRRYPEAIAELEKARAVEPDHPLVKTFLAVARFNQGEIDDAQRLVEEVLVQHPHFDGVLPVLAWCLSARGEHERARGLITERVQETARADHDIAFWVASFYGMEGLADEAVEWARTAIRLGNENYPLFADSRKLDPVRQDPRFVQLMEELRQRWEARRGQLPGR